jgi:hypothetical protein
MAAAPSSRETFAALDAETGGATTSWTHSGTHSAEAGFEDPAFGWVGVRADLGPGGIHAMVVPGSAEAAQALSGQMAGLHHHLSQHRTPVESLTLASPTYGEANYNANQGTGQNDRQNRQDETSASSAVSAAGALASRVWSGGSAPGGAGGLAPPEASPGARISIFA